jgi:hypothetical protein
LASPDPLFHLPVGLPLNHEISKNKRFLTLFLLLFALIFVGVLIILAVVNRPLVIELIETFDKKER